MAGEQSRLSKQRQEILQSLRNAGENGVTNAELSKIALRYGGHLGKLYEYGYKIDKLCLGNGLYSYTLISEPETNIVREKAITKLLDEVEKLGTVSKDVLVTLLDNHSLAVKYKSNTYKG